MLSKKLLPELREYYRHYRPEEWLFFGRSKSCPLPEGSGQKIYYQAKAAAGIAKEGGIHTLRHCFARHPGGAPLLEAGVDWRSIQEMLGHRSLKTTALYLHISTKRIQQVRSPLDALYEEKALRERRSL